ncbi:hypothetical protein [Neisseria weixii]|uniref:hypothetical protein n=1 Tax=Neisseria weixii TaxID=1853276 RepID=UPI0035A0A8CA
MSDKKYTLTVYAAAPGTPLFDDKTGLPDIDKETGKQKTSLPGHMFYAISTDGGRTKTAYGFAPREDAERAAWYSLDMPGEIQDAEHKIYLNPYYARTMEITEQQYTTLKNFGDSPEKYSFNRNTYNLATNSCIDFTFKALKESGIYKGRPIDYHKEGVKIGSVTVYEKAALRVLENIPVLEKMPNQINSPLNRTVRGEMPDRTLLQWLSTENRQQELDANQPQYAQARSLSIGDVPAPAQKLYAQTEERMRAFYQEFDVPFQEHELKNAAAALAVVAYEKRLPEVQDFELHNGRMVAFYESRGGAYKEALLDAGFANNMPQQESFVRMTEAEPKLELAAQQRAMEIAAYQQNQSMGRSI